MDLELKNKVAIISGSTRGIGKGIALMLAHEGCRVVICGRTKETLDNTAEEIKAKGGEVLPMLGDVTRSDFISEIVDLSLNTYGVIDILVNNVGGNRRNDFEKTSEEDWQTIIDLNLMSHVRMSRKVVPVMKKQKSGSIIFISSIFGREVGGPTLSIYNTTKSAIISLAKVMASELASEGIRVNSVAPGSIRFSGGSWDKRYKEDPEKIEKFIRENLPIGRFGTVEEVAGVVCFLASQKASLVTGTCINVDGCQSRSLI
jgi:3-oxoacyl-[acyl-carrier protein] reductase